LSRWARHRGETRSCSSCPPSQHLESTLQSPLGRAEDGFLPNGVPVSRAF
jgi:hypothetical protein